MTDFATLVAIEKDGQLNPAQDTELKNYRASGAGGASDGLASYDTLMKGLPSAVDYAKGLNATENSAFADYAKLASSQPLPLDLYTKLEESAGIPQLKTTQKTIQGQIYDLEDTLRRVEPDITARSGQSIVTEAQRRGMVTETEKPLIENLGWLGQSLGRVSNAITGEKADIGTKVGLAMQGFQQQLEPYKMKLTMTIDQNSRMMTGFTADRQSQLDILLAKVQRSEELSDREWQAAQDLAKEERQFENQKSMLKLEYDQPDNKVVEANGKQLLINMKDGKVIANLGSSTTGSPTIPTTVATPTSQKPTSTPSNNAYGINSYLWGILNGTN